MKLDDLLPKLIRASLDQDMKTVEACSLLLTKRLKSEFPVISKEIADILAYRKIGSSLYRSIDLGALPTDRDTRSQLAEIQEPISCERPIFSERVNNIINVILKERETSELLLLEGLQPTSSILLFGQPGVGKTFFAKWLSSILKIPLVTLDLASSMSSFLGRTGQNLKSMLDYARQNGVILLLDEIDAIGKRRDDQADLGELKRLVNVLLKELEDWSGSSILIAATNHPDLLDKALWRRFDKVIEIEMPDDSCRKQIIERCLKNYKDEIVPSIIEYLVSFFAGESPAAICHFIDDVKRRSIVFSENIKISLYNSIVTSKITNDDRKAKVTVLKGLNPDLTYRQISSLTGISLTSVQRYLSQGGHDDE